MQDVCYDVQMTGGSTLRLTLRPDGTVWAITIDGLHGNQRIGSWMWVSHSQRVAFNLRPSYDAMLAPEDLEHLNDGYKTLLAKSVVE